MTWRHQSGGERVCQNGGQKVQCILQATRVLDCGQWEDSTEAEMPVSGSAIVTGSP